MNNYNNSYNQFVVISYNNLSGADRKNLGKLYRPFIGTEANDLYIYLHDLISNDEIESDIIDYSKLYISLNINNHDEFLVIKGAKGYKGRVVNCLGEETASFTVQSDLEEIKVSRAGIIYLNK